MPNRWRSELVLRTITTELISKRKRNATDLSNLFMYLVSQRSLCRGFSPRYAVPQGIRDSASEIFGWDVGFPGGYFINWVRWDVVFVALSTGKQQLQIRKYWLLWFQGKIKSDHLTRQDNALIGKMMKFGQSGLTGKFWEPFAPKPSLSLTNFV